jgi:two-component system, OmpR family, KDP operon response regulator KdpE
MRMRFFHKHNILIVDDDQDLLVGLSVWLRAAGYQITVAPDAGSAFHAAVEHMPDLILLDLGLPGRDGLAVLQRLKDSPSTAHIPVIVITARDGSNESTVLDAGAVAFYQKPIENAELLEAIALELENRHAEAAR